MFPSTPCRLCSETDHSAIKCPELWMNRVPPPQKGGHGDDEEDSLTNSGNFLEQEDNQLNGSRAGHWNPLSVISM